MSLAAGIRSQELLGHLSRLSVAAVLVSSAEAQTLASFDSGFLHQVDGQERVDLAVFAMSDRVLPGMKSVQIQLNRSPIGMHDLSFVAALGKPDAQPCITRALLEDLGVNIQAFPKLMALEAGDCTQALAQIPMSRVTYDQDRNIVHLSIPQAAMTRRARGFVSQDRWNAGEAGFWSSYRISYNHTRHSDGLGPERNTTTFISLRNGLNIGSWRLRGNASYYDSGNESTWDWSELYAERSIDPWRAQLRLGDSVTPGNIFDASRIRGIQLQSDMGMLPDSQRGYAPVVRGIASDNAKVTVRQAGRVLYTAYVPAGPFEFDDLYSTPGGGDLEVVVEELNGRKTRFFQPYSALPTMMREGIWKYNISFGEYRRNDYSESPWMGQATFAYGLPWGLTAYGGLSIAQNSYQAGAIGLAFNMKSLGAISLDVTASRSKDREGISHRGAAARVQYAKSFLSSGTDFTLAGYRYNSEGYRSLDDSLRERNHEILIMPEFSRKHEYQLSMSQRLGDLGSLSLNYYGISYRNAPQNATYARVSFSSSIGRIGYSLNYSLDRSPWGARDHAVMLTFSIPLGGTHSASYSVNRTNSQGTSQDVSLSGALTDDYAVTYALQAGVTTGSEQNNGSHGFGSIGYSSPIGVANLSHAYAKNSSSTSLDFSGALFVDDEGVLLGQSIGETAIVVEAPGAKNVEVENYPGVRTNGQGRALIPYAQPYRENRVSLRADPDRQDATLENNVQTVVPTRGAIVVATFETQLGYSRLVVLRGADRAELPFGAAVFDTEDEQRGIVGPVGRVWLTGLKGEERFTVKWGEGRQCSFTIDTIVGENTALAAGKELTCR